MDDAAQEQRRRSSADWMNEGATRLILFLARRSILSPFAGLGPIVLAVFGVIFFFTLLILITGGGVGIGIPGSPSTTPSPTPAPIAGGPGTPGGGSGYLAQCLFQDRGNSIKIGNPEVAAFIDNTAKKINVPATLIMAISRRELGSFFGDAKPETFQNDFNDTKSPYRDPKTGESPTGVMQIMPSTFRYVVDKYAGELKEKFDKEGSNLDISQQPADPTKVFWIASIRDSIIIGSYYLRSIKEAKFGESAPWNDKTLIDNVAGGYHGGPAKPIGESCIERYCDDVWESMQNCERSPILALEQLHDSVNAVCPTEVRSSNVEKCIANIPSSLNKFNVIKDIIRASVNLADEFVLQCVGFVETAVEAANFPTLLGANKRGAAKLYANSPHPSGYSFIPRGSAPIRVGDIPIWDGVTPSSAGHIAFVIDVLDATRFKVMEANYCEKPKYQYPCGIIGKRDETLNESRLRGWLRRNQ